MQPRAMLLAGERLYVAGWRDYFGIELKTGLPKQGVDTDQRDSVLCVYDAESGEHVAEYSLEDEPVFDGAATAYGDLLIALKNGKLVCMGADAQ